MYLCYVDEAGCTGALPSSTSPIQPVFILSGLIVHADHVQNLTRDYLHIKRCFYPGLLAQERDRLDWILPEVKGADLRKKVAAGSRRTRSHVVGYMDKVRDTLNRYDARLVGRVWIKGIGVPFDGNSVYTFSVQDILRHFQHFLEERGDAGLVIADSRNKPKNAKVSHSIFTQKYRFAGDPYSRIAEMPVFGHSDNHAMVQLADLINSAFIAPIAVKTYCTGHVDNLHVRQGYTRIKSRYVNDIKKIQYRYSDPVTGLQKGGLIISDAIAHRTGSAFFRQDGPNHHEGRQ